MQFYLAKETPIVMDGMIAAVRQMVTNKGKLADHEVKITFNLGE